MRLHCKEIKKAGENSRKGSLLIFDSGCYRNQIAHEIVAESTPHYDQKFIITHDLLLQWPLGHTIFYEPMPNVKVNLEKDMNT
ncbi:hypothetical protein H5410_034597 [Solanum commersonii]|uniref:Uncharacterized protein n=1 Tax=Solanum commersonii TaxID=4109 RepID=A0A9J5YR34_SOLCO|nr:hypothetical protein H5410_034597 [Solanum commersonii]